MDKDFSGSPSKDGAHTIDKIKPGRKGRKTSIGARNNTVGAEIPELKNLRNFEFITETEIKMKLSSFEKIIKRTRFLEDEGKRNGIRIKDLESKIRELRGRRDDKAKELEAENKILSKQLKEQERELKATSLKGSEEKGVKILTPRNKKAAQAAALAEEEKWSNQFEHDRQISSLELENKTLHEQLKDNENLITDLVQKLDELRVLPKAHTLPHPHSHTHKNANIKRHNQHLHTNQNPQHNQLHNQNTHKNKNNQLDYSIPKPAYDSDSSPNQKTTFLFNKGELLKNHSLIKETKNLLFEGLKFLQASIAKALAKNGKVIGIMDSVFSNLDVLFNIVHQFEIRELQYLNMLTQVSEQQPLPFLSPPQLFNKPNQHN